MSTRVLAGTSGYSHKAWRGRFYPPDVHQDGWLGYYGSRLPAVEINNTFYRMPHQYVVETWRDSVPDGFRFVLKASRRITHQKQLQDVEEPLGYLLSRAGSLGGKLGALLFQLPPYLRADLERFERFQTLLPDDLPVAFEFRHESWDDPAVDEMLARRGHARVVSHERGTPAAIRPGPLVYLRLRSPDYAESELMDWHDRILASGADQAFVFFKHEDEAGGPVMAEHFLNLIAARSGSRGTARASAGRSGRRPSAPGRKHRREPRGD